MASKRERLRKLKGLLRDPDLETVRQGIDLALSLDDTSVMGTLLEGCRLDRGRPVLGTAFHASKKIDANLRFAWLALVGGASDKVPRHASLKSPTLLDVSELRLPAWPDTTPAFASLERVFLSRCWLTEVPGFIAGLAALRELRLDRNQLDTLAHIETLGAIERLDLSHNRLDALGPEVCRNSLRHLDVRDNPIQQLASGLGYLPELRTLLFRNAKLGELPTLPQLSKLERLEATRCGVSRVQSFEGLSHLETLDLRDNELRALPDSIDRLSSLETLDVSNNQLTSLPKTIGTLSRLRRIRASFNRMPSLPDSIGNASGLRLLTVADNPLSELPSSLGSLAGLRQLDVSRGQLEALDLTGCRALRRVDASQNQIGELDLTDCSDLESLVATDNIISKIAGLAQAKQLETLDLSRNRMRGLPKKMSESRRLKTLLLGANRLDRFPEGPWPALVELDLTENRIQELPQLHTNLTMQRLNVSENRLDAITAESLPPRLRELVAMNASIGILAGAFDALPLTRVVLSGNGLTELPESLLECKTLQDLDVRDNPLSEATKTRLAEMNRVRVRL